MHFLTILLFQIVHRFHELKGCTTVVLKVAHIPLHPNEGPHSWSEGLYFRSAIRHSPFAVQGSVLRVTGSAHSLNQSPCTMRGSAHC